MKKLQGMEIGDIPKQDFQVVEIMVRPVGFEPTTYSFGKRFWLQEFHTLRILKSN